MLKQSGGGPFYKTGPLYVTGDPTDPTKKESAEKEAKAKAEKSTAEAKKVYGKSTTTQERFKDDRGTGTRTTVTTPYTRSGTGSAEFNTAYGAAKKAGKKTFDYEGKLIKVKDSGSKSGKDVKTTVKYDPIKTASLKPQEIKLTTAMPSASIDISKDIFDKEFDKPESEANYKLRQDLYHKKYKGVDRSSMSNVEKLAQNKYGNLRKTAEQRKSASKAQKKQIAKSKLKKALTIDLSKKGARKGSMRGKAGCPTGNC